MVLMSEVMVLEDSLRSYFNHTRTALSYAQVRIYAYGRVFNTRGKGYSRRMLIIEYTPLDHGGEEAGYRCERCGERVEHSHARLAAHGGSHGALGYRIRPQSEDIA